ncbi:MAG: 1-acyl-sn-glycerol-3-phosphate acyltransferase [Ruminococcaceae bacterium]|nr:1-acyl-sn-glycerol-3-phosphate acyltransferase [Oscillospiraceae bacterium]
MNSKKNSRSKKDSPFHHFLYDFVKITGSIPALIWMRPRVIYPGEKQCLKGGILVCSNHCTFVDPILLHCVFWQRRIYSLATKDLYCTKLRKWFFSRVHCIQVDKENFSVNSFHEVIHRLNQGRMVSIFPEGEVNRAPEELLAFKSGAILMAHRAKVPILPLYIVPGRRWYQRRLVLIGDPIDVRELCGAIPTVEDIHRAGDYVHQMELQLQEYYQTKILKNKKPQEGEQ